MTRRRRIYELRIGGALACRGDICECASVLGISTDTMRGYIDGRAPRWAELEPLPILFRLEGDGGVFVGTRAECAEFLARSEQSVMSNCRKGIRLAGYSISRVPYERFALPICEVDALIASAKRDNHFK